MTRPAEDAVRWVQALQAQGIAAQALPLIDIVPVLDDAARDRLWQALPSWQALMFVSSNAVNHFFGTQPRPWPPGVRALAPGPGTAAALRQRGVPPAQIDQPDAQAAQFDSEALWQAVRGQPWAGRRVCVVRGQDAGQSGADSAGRDWLARTLEAAGAQVQALAVYRRAAPVFTPEQLACMARARSDGTLWLLSSSQAVAHLPPGWDWTPARALATHERIAQAARRAGFGWVGLSRPTLADVAASIKSAHP